LGRRELLRTGRGMSEVWREWPVLVRRKQVMETGLSRWDLKRLVAQGRLHPVRVTGRYAKYWRDELAPLLVGENKATVGGEATSE